MNWLLPRIAPGIYRALITRLLVYALKGHTETMVLDMARAYKLWVGPIAHAQAADSNDSNVGRSKKSVIL